MFSAVKNIMKTYTESEFEASQMRQLPDHFETVPGSEAESSTCATGSSITACKKVLCSNSLLDSAEYWLRNEKKLCQVGFLEDKAGNSCPTICFVNLDGVDAKSNRKEFQQKLVTVSPDLPYLINSLNVCQMKDNELILVSGLISPGSHGSSDDSQGLHPNHSEDDCFSPLPPSARSPDVCLVQSARKCRKNDMACVIYEINKCMIGLDYVKGKKIHLHSTTNCKSGDDTNCSVSSIEEDFLTASEHFDDEEIEASNILSDPLRTNHSDPSRDTKKPKGKPRTLLHMRQNKENVFLQRTCNAEDNSASQHTGGESSENTVQTLTCESNCVSGEGDTGRHNPEEKTQEETPICKSFQSIVSAKHRVGEEHSSCTTECVGKHLQRNSLAEFLHAQDAEENQNVEGEYASNLAESVLQDAFIRLSQSEPTFTTEAAVSISAENQEALSPSNTKEDATNLFCPWNVLPKIVIVQSPDNCENVPEWQEPFSPTMASRLDLDPLSEPPACDQEPVVEQKSSESSGLPPGSVELALVCAASVVGTISSPCVAESLQLDRALCDADNLSGNRNDEGETLFNDSECHEMNFSFSSALYGVTQVASAIGIAGFNDEADIGFSATSSGLLSAAETSAAITLHCSVSVGSCVETFAGNIADVLLKEAATVLTKPDRYKSVGELMESLDRKLIETMTSPKVSPWEELSRDDFAQNVSNLILQHSFQEANGKVGILHQEQEKHSEVNPTSIFIESANKSLFSIIYSTCKKIKDVVRHNDLSVVFQEDEGYNWNDLDNIIKQKGGVTQNYHGNDSFEDFGQTIDVLPFQENLMDSAISNRNRSEGPDFLQQVNLNSVWLCNRRGSDCSNNAHNLTDQLRSRIASAAIANYVLPEHQQKVCDKEASSHFFIGTHETDTGFSGVVPAQTCGYTNAPAEAREFQRTKSQPEKEPNFLALNAQNALSPSKSSFHVVPSTDTNLSINGFADQISKTVVSMATEMAAICLENTNAKQPWFCPWKRKLGDPERFMVPQSSSSRVAMRSKESQTMAPNGKRLKPPRLSEIKRKTQEQPELKEKLMNRVVDESLNFDDALEPISHFANEVAAKIVNSAELAMVDSVKQGQAMTRNRLLCERWSRGKASSYESIPEEDPDSSSSWAALGAMTMLGQPISRASSISKQSSCESITDEFSNFMVNQMENEGWGFDLLLDYYAGKHASNILNAALQQACRKNGHLSVNTSCLSKQSSTESITEEFYRYMLQELDKESKENKTSNDLLVPAGRTVMCFRQSSMPNRRTSEERLSVTPPMKANSLDGFAQNDRRNTLDMHMGDTALPTHLYKSLTDSCLYRKCKTDHITDMLISETWSNSIEALMRKNKIIRGDADSQSAEQLPSGAQPLVDQYVPGVVADAVRMEKLSTSSWQDSIETVPHDPGTRNRNREAPFRHKLEKTKTVIEKKGFTSHDAKKMKLSHNPREVPLIHIEDDHREEIKDRLQTKTACNTKASTEKRLLERKLPEVDSEGHSESSSITTSSTMKNPVAAEKATADEIPCSLSTSDDSMGSWSQLINEEDHAEDSSSYLHLSESNGNSSTSSSLGLVDLDAYQESLSSRALPSEIVSEKETVKNTQEHLDDQTFPLSMGTVSRHPDFLVLNFDLNPEGVDSELRAILQWIAASELGFPVIYFRKSQEKKIQKFLDVVHSAQRKAWKLKDLFLAILQYCKVQEEGGSVLTRSLFDWLLEFG
ncbi:A-kinase anchor protein SPHKAP isoform X2 [Scyliorhinus canicula]|uniref:A-kinase anchor protein SPHKAP isoform X2 n=1 Tax=Scyliorhinus canicula TaxID=7830 RepID=UPI0018F69917|nr:A-kinase anchor protein SPHKAP isoform X2 [Scyliorhinus canicula]XP_038671167.1 A-kinase anchor protein SPHKAP isoform X2 [Scyliorhinus canicula]